MSFRRYRLGLAALCDLCTAVLLATFIVCWAIASWGRLSLPDGSGLDRTAPAVAAVSQQLLEIGVEATLSRWVLLVAAAVLIALARLLRRGRGFFQPQPRWSGFESRLTEVAVRSETAATRTPPYRQTPPRG